MTFVDFSSTAVNICFREGYHNYSVGFTLHIWNNGSVIIIFIVSGMQSDQNSGDPNSLTSCAMRRICQKNVFSEIKVLSYFQNSK